MGPVTTSASTKSTQVARSSKDVLPKPEKRAKRYRFEPNQDIRARIGRAFSQRLYLVNQEDISTGDNNLGRKYAVLGSTGNVYNVVIARLPSCTCPDSARGNLCKHIIFVMAKVLQVSPNSPLIYQLSYLQTELATIFANAPTPSAVVLAKQEVVSAYQKTLHGDDDVVKEEKNDEVVATAPTAEKEPEGDCPVCFESMTGKEALDSCSTCKNFIHQDCIKQWLKIQRTCCYCRTEWCSLKSVEAAGSSSSVTGAAAARTATPAAADMTRDGGYVNFGAQQGLPGRRDTSTYFHGHNLYKYGFHH